MQTSSVLHVRSSSSPWLGLLILAIAVLVAYSNSLHGPFIFDDESSIVENPSINSWRTVLFPPGNSGLTVSGRPLVNISIAINYALGGMNVFGYHVVNVCIHLFATFALYGLVRRALLLPLLRNKYEAHAWWLALAAAAVWGLHPLQTESVTYMIQRAESMVGLFYIFTMYLFVRSVERPDLKRYKVATVISCVLGMASKEVMVTAPVVIFLFDRVFIAGSFAAAWRERRALHLGLLATWLVLAACIISTGKRGATVGFSVQVDAWRYAMTQCYAIIHYLKLVFWPYPLVLDYGGPLANNFADVATRALLLAVLVGGSFFLLWRKPRVGFFLVGFFLLLAPTSSIVPVLTQTVAEHRMYVPLAPLVVLLVIGTGTLFSNRGVYLWMFVSLLLGIRTYVRNHDYRSAEAIWISVTENCAYNIRGWNSLALTYTIKGDHEKAREAMEMALRTRPNDPEVIASYANVLVKVNKRAEAENYLKQALQIDSAAYDANYNYGVLLLEDRRFEQAADRLLVASKIRPGENLAHYNLGKAYVELNRLDDAAEEFRGILKRDNKATDARNNLANALLGLNKPEEAIAVLREGIKVTPQSTELYRTLGLALITIGQFEDAARQLQTAIKLDKDDAKAHANLGLALLSLGNAKEACVHYETALAVPGGLNAEMARALHVSCGEELLKLGEIVRAREHYEKAVENDSSNTRIRYALADLLLQTGENAEAARHLELIVRADPTFSEAHCELGLAYCALGRLREARTCIEQALRLNPENQSFREGLSRLDDLERR